MLHINICNMAMHDAHQCSKIFVTHLPPDETNVTDLFTKDDAHFLRFHNIIVLSHGISHLRGVLVQCIGYSAYPTKIPIKLIISMTTHWPFNS